MESGVVETVTAELRRTTRVLSVPEDVDYTLYDTLPFVSGKTKELVFGASGEEDLSRRNITCGVLGTKLLQVYDLRVVYLYRGLNPIRALLVPDIAALVGGGHASIYAGDKEYGPWPLTDLFPGGDYALMALLLTANYVCIHKNGRKLGIRLTFNPHEKFSFVVKWPHSAKLQTGPWEVQFKATGFARRPV